MLEQSPAMVTRVTASLLQSQILREQGKSEGARLARAGSAPRI